MRTLVSLATVERELLTRYPVAVADPFLIAEFEDTFGSSVVEAADTVTLLMGVVKPDDLVGIAERLATIVTDAVSSAASQLGVSSSPWIDEAQAWAVESFFARISEVRDSMAKGGAA